MTKDPIQIFLYDEPNAATLRIDEIREFDTANAQVDFTVSLLGPISVTGKYAAMQLRVQRAGIPDFAATDVFEFDENGKIISLSVVLDPQALC